MKSISASEELELSVWEDTAATVVINYEYYRTSYGDDIDGNRGVPCLELGKYDIIVPKYRHDGSEISDEEADELYAEAESELERMWHEWAESNEDSCEPEYEPYY